MACAIWRKVRVSSNSEGKVNPGLLFAEGADIGRGLDGVGTWGKVLYTAMMCSEEFRRSEGHSHSYRPGM